MSIQASINQALSSVELALLRTGAVPTSKREYVGEDAGEAPETAQAAEAKKTGEEPTNGTAEQQTSQNEASEAATNPAAQVIANGNMTAGAIASGRVQAKQQQIIAAKSTSADRLAQLREMKAAARKDVRKIKSEERQIRRQLEKEGGGE